MASFGDVTKHPAVESGARSGLLREAAFFTLAGPLRIAVINPLLIVLLEYLSSMIPDRFTLAGWPLILLGAVPYFWSGWGVIFFGKDAAGLYRVTGRAMFIGGLLVMLGLAVVLRHGAILFYTWQVFFHLLRTVNEHSQAALRQKFQIAVISPLVIVLLEYLSSMTPDKLRLAGWAPILLGAIPYFWGAWEFIFTGRGTPSPRVPPQALVTTGLYRVTRNPMFVGILLVIVGLAVVSKHGAILFYAWQTFFRFRRMLEYEEPTLREKFGMAFEDYCRKVPRWLWR